MSRVRVLGFAFAVVLLTFTTEARASVIPVVELDTSLGKIQLTLDPVAAPLTVANFLGYVNRGDYDNSYIHRSIPSFIFQGGSLAYEGGSFSEVPDQAPVPNEFGRSNVRGTIAMAKLDGDPDSATNGWFINLANNGPTTGPVPGFDSQNGGFTVFGEVTLGLDVVNAIAALPRFNAGGELNNLPLRDYTPPAPGAPATDWSQHLVLVNTARVIAVPEPGTLTLLGAGLAAIGSMRRRRV